MEAISSQVEPKIGSDGAKYRRKQMMYQLPIHDHDENYCDNLTEPEKASMRQFCEDRNQNALGVGDVREKNNPVSKWVSELFTTRTRRSTVVRRLYFVLQPVKPLISLKKKTKQTNKEGRTAQSVSARLWCTRGLEFDPGISHPCFDFFPLSVALVVNLNTRKKER